LLSHRGTPRQSIHFHNQTHTLQTPKIVRPHKLYTYMYVCMSVHNISTALELHLWIKGAEERLHDHSTAQWAVHIKCWPSAKFSLTPIIDSTYLHRYAKR